jgi:hypothetical protein
MGSIGSVKVNVNEIPTRCVVKLRATGVRRFTARLWLAKQLFRLGAWIARVGLDFSMESEGECGPSS